MQRLFTILRDRRFIWIVKVSLGILLLRFLFSSIDARLFLQTLGTIRPIPGVIAVALFYPGHLIASWRWQYLVARAGSRVAFWRVFRYYLWGQVSSLVLPSQLSGDVVRTFAIVQDESHKRAFVVSTILDKLSVLVAILVFVLFGLFVRPLSERYFVLFVMALPLLAGAIGIFCAFAVGEQRRSRVVRGLVRLLRLEKLVPQGQKMTFSLSPKDIVIVLGLSLIVQTFNSVGSYFMAGAFSIQLDPIAWATIGAMVSFAQMIPLTPGSIGIREGLFVTLLALYGIPAEQSIAYSLFGFGCVALLLIVAWIGMEGIRRLAPNLTHA